MTLAVSVLLLAYYMAPALIGLTVANWVCTRRYFTGWSSLSLVLVPGFCWVTAQQISGTQKSLSNLIELYLVAGVATIAVFLRLKFPQPLATTTATWSLIAVVCAFAVALAIALPALPE